MDTKRYLPKTMQKVSPSTLAFIFWDRLKFVYTYKMVDIDTPDFQGDFHTIQAVLKDAKRKVK